jgi:ribosomal subunit interface protein
MSFETGRPVITVESANFDLGAVLPVRARKAIMQVAEKYFGRLNAAAVYVSREGSKYRSTVNIQMGGLDLVTAEASHQDCYRAFDLALDKAAKRLWRMKRKLSDDKPVRLEVGLPG